MGGKKGKKGGGGTKESQPPQDHTSTSQSGPLVSQLPPDQSSTPQQPVNAPPVQSRLVGGPPSGIAVRPLQDAPLSATQVQATSFPGLQPQEPAQSLPQQAPTAAEIPQSSEPGGSKKKKKKKPAQNEDGVTQPSSSVPTPVQEKPQQPQLVSQPSQDLSKSAPSQPQQAAEVAETPQVSESGGSKKKKKKKPAQDRDAVTQPSTTPPAAGGQSTSAQSPAHGGTKTDKAQGAGEALIKDLTKMSVRDVKSKYQVPQKIMRKKNDQTTCLKTCKIEVNYLPLIIRDFSIDLFHYDVTFKPEKPKSLYRQAVHIMIRRNCPGRHPAFDGKKNLYAARTHLFTGSVLRDSIDITDPEDGNRTKTFDIIILKTSQKITMKDLKRYTEVGRSQDIPQDVVQATDIALRSGLYDAFIPCARSFFSGPMKPPVDLEKGMQLYDGFFQSAIMGQKRAFLNVDVSNKAFPYDQTVLDYLRKVLQLQDQDFRRPLDKRVQNDLHEYLKGLKVSYNPQGSQRTYRCNGVWAKSAMTHRFQPDGKREMCVAEYFSKEKRITLQYSELPLLHVGPPKKMILVPIEFCRIIGRQAVMRKLDERQTAAMVKAAARPTDERKQRIMNSIRSANYRENEVLTKEFGITVDTKFHEVNSYVFKPPDICYKTGLVTPVNGEWRMDRHNFRKPSEIKSWAVLIKDANTNPMALQDRDGLVPLLITCGKQLGIDVAAVKQVLQASKGQSQREIEADLKELNRKHGGLQIVIVILPGGRPHSKEEVKDGYGNVKRASEWGCGVLTQCLKAFTATRKMNSMTAINILLKINAKVNGVNHSLGGPLK